MHKKSIFLIGFLSIGFLMAGCSSTHVETAPATKSAPTVQKEASATSTKTESKQSSLQTPAATDKNQKEINQELNDIDQLTNSVQDSNLSLEVNN